MKLLVMSDSQGHDEKLTDMILAHYEKGNKSIGARIRFIYNVAEGRIILLCPLAQSLSTPGTKKSPRKELTRRANRTV